MDFSKLIFSYAALLIIDGLAFQYIAQTKDISIIMPVVFGGFILIMGFMSLKKDLELFGRHGATAVSLIAFVTSVGSILELFSDTVQYSDLSNFVMAVLSLAFIVFAVQQFAAERGKEESGNGKMDS
jgi:hypothetical protein